MADLGQFEADTTRDKDLYDQDNDFERVDADDRPFGNEFPEEDSYDPDASDQPESAQFPTEETSSTVPTGDLLSLGGGGAEPKEREDEIPAPSSNDPAQEENSDILGLTSSTNAEPESSASIDLQTDEKIPVTSSLLQEQPSDPAIHSEGDEKEVVPACCGKSIEELLCLKNLDPRVVELVYWRDIKKSAVVFSSGLLVLLALGSYSVISVVAYFLLALLTVTIGFRVYKSVMAAIQKSEEGNPFKPFMEKDLTLSQDQIDHYTQNGVKRYNSLALNLRHYLLVEDILDSIKFAVVLYLLTYLGSWFNGLTLVILAYILIFAVPVIYEKYQREIDEAVCKIYKQVDAQLVVIKEKVPWLKKKEE